MAVQAQLLPITLRGLAQKAPSNLAVPGDLVTAQNVQVLKGSSGGIELSKRFGTTALSQDVRNGYPGPAVHLTTLGSQLVAEGTLGVAAYDAQQFAWQNHAKGGLGFASDTTSISQSLYQKTSPSMAIDPNHAVECYAWFDGGQNSVVFSVRSRDTGVYTAFEIPITGSMSYSSSFKAQVLAPGDGNFYVWYPQLTTGYLQCAAVPVLQPLAWGVVFTAVNTDAASTTFDITQTPEKTFLIAVKITLINPTLIVFWDPATRNYIGSTSYATPAVQCYSWLPDNNPGALGSRIYYLLTLDTSGIVLYGFPDSLGAPSVSTMVTPPPLNVNNVAGYVDFGTVNVFYDTIVSPTATNDAVYKFTSSFVPWIRSVRFASKPFYLVAQPFALRAWYALVRFDSVIQPTLFLVDLATMQPVGKVSTDGPMWASYTAQGHLQTAKLVSGKVDEWVIATSAGHETLGQTATSAVGTELMGVYSSHFDASPTVSAPVELGGALHFPGSIPYTFDGATIRESGFNLFPEAMFASDSGAGTANPVGTLSYRATYRRQDANGNIAESAPSVPFVFTAVNTHQVTVLIPTLRVTTATDVFIDVWRDSVAQPSSQTPRIYHKVNGFPIPNDRTVDTVSFTDNLSEADWAAREVLYTSNSEIEHIAPPSSTLIATAQNRTFLAGIDRDPSAILVSNEWVAGGGNQVSYLDANIVNVQGNVTAIAGRDRNVIVFTLNSIWTLTGEYPDATGGGNGFPVPIRLQHPVGAISQAGVVVTGSGIFFQSLKGIYILDWGFNCTYIGAQIEDDLGTKKITSGLDVPELNQVRLYTAEGTTFVYDTLFGVWTTFTGQSAVSATSWNALPVYISTDSGGAFLTNTETPGTYGDDGSFVGSYIEMAFIAPAQLRGYFCLFALQLLGKILGPHTLNASLAYSSESFATTQYTFNNIGVDIYGDVTYGVGLFGGTGDGVLRCEIRPKKRQSASYSLTLWDTLLTSGTSQGFSLEAVSALVGIETGLTRQAVSQRMVKS